MTAREQLEAEAAELYPVPRDPYTPHEAFQERAAHVRAKTISAEQIEAAAEALRHAAMAGSSLGNHAPPWERMAEQERHHFRIEARAALTAAGLLIEGGDDE